MAEEFENQEEMGEEVENQEEINDQDDDVNNDDENAQEERDESQEESGAESDDEDVNNEENGDDEQSESLGEIIKAKYPDVSDENLEEYTTKYITDLQGQVEELTEYQEKNREINGKLVEVLDSSDELGNIIKDMDKGASFIEALTLNVNLDDIKPTKGTPEYKKWEEAKSKRAERVEQARKSQEEFETNRNESISTLRTFFEENKIEQKDAEKFTGKVDEIIGNINKGKWDAETLTFFWNALNAEQKIKEAEQVGKLKAKNEKIQAKKKENKGDGIPKLSTSSKIKKPEKKSSPVDNIVDSFTSKQNRF